MLLKYFFSFTVQTIQINIGQVDKTQNFSNRITHSVKKQRFSPIFFRGLFSFFLFFCFLFVSFLFCLHIVVPFLHLTQWRKFIPLFPRSQKSEGEHRKLRNQQLAQIVKLTENKMVCGLLLGWIFYHWLIIKKKKISHNF